MTAKERGSLSPNCQSPVCRSVLQHPRMLCSVDCRAGNPSSRRHSFRVRNDLPEWENIDRPVTHSTLCNTLAARSGRMGECGWPATDPLGGRGAVVEAHLTRKNLYHRAGCC